MVRKVDLKGVNRTFQQIEESSRSVSIEMIDEYQKAMSKLLHSYASVNYIHKEAEGALKFISAYLTSINYPRGFFDSVTITKDLPRVLRFSAIKMADFVQASDQITLYDLACITSGLRVMLTFTGVINTDLDFLAHCHPLEVKLSKFTDSKLDCWAADLLEVWGHTMLGYPEHARKSLLSLKKKKIPEGGFSLKSLSSSKKGFKNNNWVNLIDTLKATSLSL